MWLDTASFSVIGGSAGRRYLDRAGVLHGAFRTIKFRVFLDRNQIKFDDYLGGTAQLIDQHPALATLPQPGHHDASQLPRSFWCRIFQREGHYLNTDRPHPAYSSVNDRADPPGRRSARIGTMRNLRYTAKGTSWLAIDESAHAQNFWYFRYIDRLKSQLLVMPQSALDIHEARQRNVTQH